MTIENGSLMADTRLTTHPDGSGMVDVIDEELTLDDVYKHLQEFEDLYGVSSERFTDAFRDSTGVLHETADYHRWAHLFAIWEYLSNGHEL